MSETVTLRRLGPDDLETLLAVRHGLFDNAVLPEQAKAFLADPLHEIMLAFVEAEAVGMATGQLLLHPDKQPVFLSPKSVCETNTSGKASPNGFVTR